MISLLLLHKNQLKANLQYKHILSGMALALEQAHSAFKVDQVPVGAALIAADGSILAYAHNNRSLILGHAEILALLQCHGPYLPDGTTLFVTLEPCPLCAAAIMQARLSRLVFGAYDPKGGAVEHGSRLLEESSIQVVGGVQETECADLLQRFFRARRC